MKTEFNNRNVLIEFLTDERNNSKWLEYAENRINRTAKIQRVGCLEAADYISEVKVVILETVTVSYASLDFPRFVMVREGETISMTCSDLMNYFFALLFWKLSNSFKREKRIVPLPYQDEVEDEDPGSGDDNPDGADNPGNEFIVPFNDPFEDSLNYLTKEFVEECCRILEEEDSLYRMIFEEFLNGKHNREIAQKYKLPVRKVENIRKIINRRLRGLRG